MMQTKIKRMIAALAALAALALGGSAIAGAAGGGTDAGKPVAADTEAPGHESEDDQSLKGPEADKARAAAEQSTGGKANEVQRDNAESEQDEGADDDGGPEQGYQSPANTAYEVEVDKGGKEIEVYLDSDFQVLDTQTADEQESSYCATPASR